MIEYIQQLIRIYNGLCTIETKGENTIVMGECLKAMQQVVNSMQANMNKKPSEAEKEV